MMRSHLTLILGLIAFTGCPAADEEDAADTLQTGTPSDDASTSGADDDAGSASGAPGSSTAASGSASSTGGPGNDTDPGSGRDTEPGSGRDTDFFDTDSFDTDSFDTGGPFEPAIGECLPEACRPVLLECDYDGCASDHQGAVDCHVQQLAESWNGTPAYLLVDESLGGISHAALLALGDGTVLVEGDGFSTVQLCPLRSPEDLLACVGNGSDDDCYGLHHAFFDSAGCVDADPSCPG